MNEELRRFIKEALEQGQSREAIKDVLLQAGWAERDLRHALASFAEVDFPLAVPKPRPYLHAREAFLYLVSFIALYVTAFSFGSLIFGLIDITFQGSLDRIYDSPSQGQAMAMSAVIVAFPVYLLLMRWLAKQVAADPERRQSLVRRWLTYLTLVVGSAIILGDLIVLVSRLLMGDPTVSFALKAATILVISAVILGYYLWDMRQVEAQAGAVRVSYPPLLRYLVIVIIGVVVLAVGYAIFLMGTPSQQRDLWSDKQRIADLRDISYNIDIYWELNEGLPQSLDQLTGPRYSVRSITDPATDAPYEYLPAAEGADYQLCAEFATASSREDRTTRSFSESVWDHEAGRACFALKAEANLNR